MLTKDPSPMPLGIREPITDALNLDQEMLGLLRQLSLCILLLSPQDQIRHPRTTVLVILGKVLEDGAQGRACNSSGHIVQVLQGVLPGDSITDGLVIGVVRIDEPLFELLFVTELSQAAFD
jgi:hypothetical protein